MSKPYIPVVLGTGRQGRESEKVASYLWNRLQKQPVVTELVDVRDYATGVTVRPEDADERVEPWRNKASRADGFIFVFPEYNHGYPGELKILLDSASKEYNYKPALLCSVSNGSFGGVRAADHLLPVLRELKMIPLKESLIFPKVPELFQKSRREVDEMYEKRVEGAMSALLAYVMGTAALRQRS